MSENQADLWESEQDPSEEDESDIQGAGSGAVVTATDWTTETILGQLRRGNIELSPSFQRREAWTPERQSRFIESLLLRYPVPQLVLAERKEQRGQYIVIDRKQRLLALRKFGASEDDDFAQLSLTGLELVPELNGQTLESMKQNTEHASDVTAFENETIRSVVVRNWPDDSYLYRVFLRLNTGSVPLSPQELRQALNPGPFSDYVDARSADSKELHEALGIHAPDFRMRDTEILVRFYAYTFFLSDYAGSLKQFLDKTCSTLNHEWDDREAEIEAAADNCDRAIEATRTVFKENAFRRWNRERFEGRFNRAVFDVMAYYFKDSQIRTAAVAHADDVISGFKDLCENNQDFNAAISSTTKSLDATATRLRLWGEVLKLKTGLYLSIPSRQGNRITV